MKTLRLFFVIVITSWSAHAAVLLDEDWDDGDRTDTNFPEESAWFASSVLATTPTLSASVGSLTGNVLMFETNTSSRLWITHFTPAGTPAELAMGETLKVTMVFSASQVTTNPGTARGLRIGLFNFSEPGASRVSADGFSTGSGGGAPGTNVTGYMLNMNFAQSLVNSPLQIMKRTDLATNNLMGALAVYSSLGTGGGPAGAPGFSNDVPYTMELSVKRLDTSVEITSKFSDTNGWSISHKVVDTSNPTLRFDGFALRPNSVADTAQSFTFTRFKVEQIPLALRFTSIHFDSPGVLTLTWDSIPNQSYQVEFRDDLENGFWNFLGAVIATGESSSIQDPNATWIQRFYRIVQF
jgi:hypothetical protein